MRAHWVYLKYVLLHKWYVFVACCKRGICLRGFFHDWHKFLPDEWLSYIDKFYHPDGSPKPYKHVGDERNDMFERAWLAHQRRSKHHWQAWILRMDNGETKPLPMPYKYVKEMVCDWIGAGRAQGKPDTVAWWKENQNKMLLHETTFLLIEDELAYHFCEEKYEN